MCEISSLKDLRHVIFECENYNEKRECEWNIVKENIPLPMCQSLDNMTLSEKCRFVLSGMHGNYMPEFDYVYDIFLKFIFAMYFEYEASE